MKNKEKMLKLIQRLKARNNGAYEFFEALVMEFESGTDTKDSMQKLLSCFAITQHANFTPEEEKLLSEVIEANIEKH